MKRIVIPLPALLLTATLAWAEAVPGRPAPDFTAQDINGETHKLSDYKDKIVVLEAYNQDCPFCHNHYRTGAMQELQKWATDKGVVWFVVNSVNAHNPGHRDRAAAKKEYAAEKMHATAWIDDTSGKLGRAYGLKTTPTWWSSTRTAWWPMTEPSTTVPPPTEIHAPPTTMCAPRWRASGRDNRSKSKPASPTDAA